MRNLILTAAFCALAVPSPASGQGGTCGGFTAAMRQAYREAKPQVAAQILHRAEGAHLCSGGQLASLGEQAALVFYKAAFAGGKSAQDKAYLLREGLKLGRPWQTLAALGDMMVKGGRYAAAAGLFAEAWENSATAGARVRAILRRKADVSALLAPGYTPPVMRCGQKAPAGGGKGGTILARRGCAGDGRPPAPVPFAPGSASLTPRARAFAAAMLAWAERKKARRIELTGYSDRRGNALANFRLSMARARAVRRYLRAHGFKGGVIVRARGETAPPAVFASLPSRAAMRASRRVDMRIDGIREETR